jgi:hypothetical protein
VDAATQEQLVDPVDAKVSGLQLQKSREVEPSYLT